MSYSWFLEPQQRGEIGEEPDRQSRGGIELATLGFVEQGTLSCATKPFKSSWVLISELILRPIRNKQEELSFESHRSN
uniref:Uncharacterized protein n=1 Tax=Anguilla anguilla TaxID=7936 RepID=A0A0E9XYL3_ANGAN